MTNRSSDHSGPDDERGIRVARHGEMEQVAQVLSDAFAEDPVFTWFCGQPRIYREFFRFEAEALYERHSHVYVNEARTGAAMWLPPGVAARVPLHWRILPVASKLVATAGLTGARRARILDKTMSASHPSERHFYLRSIGVRRESQGRGTGSALIQAGLDLCDRHHVPAYLESSNERNNALYQRHGFEIVSEASLPERGPTIWFMRRDAT
jgi:ribosomal protein S18 acetylase RimI-like enzyme